MLVLMFCRRAPCRHPHQCGHTDRSRGNDFSPYQLTFNVNNRDDVPTTAMVSRQQPWHTMPQWAKTFIFCSKLTSDHITAFSGETGPIWRFKLLNICECFWSKIKKCQQSWWCAYYSNGEQTTALTYQSTMDQKCQILFRTHQWWKNSSKNEDLNHWWTFLNWNCEMSNFVQNKFPWHRISKTEKLSLEKRVQSEDLRHLPFASK